MKKILLFAALSLGFNSFGQILNIPDASFKTYLVGNAAINTNMDTEIQVAEANAFTGAIACNSLNISSLIGIEAFTSINYLNCWGNQLTSLDVSGNTALVELYCYQNQLTSLDVSQNNALIALNCWNNQLQCLNVKNGNNANFVSFTSTGNPNLTCIEVDDVSWSTTNWTVLSQHIDSQMSFSTYCNNACSVGLEELSSQDKELIKIVNLLGQEVEYKPNTPLIYIYSDGSTERVMKIEE